jgi:hypothetical protein
MKTKKFMLIVLILVFTPVFSGFLIHLVGTLFFPLLSGEPIGLFDIYSFSLSFKLGFYLGLFCDFLTFFWMIIYFAYKKIKW